MTNCQGCGKLTKSGAHCPKCAKDLEAFLSSCRESRIKINEAKRGWYYRLVAMGVTDTENHAPLKE